MKHKVIVLASVLTASLAFGSTAQAHDDYGYPIGLLSGVILGLSLDHDDNYYYYRDRRHRHYRHRHYPHREYRRQHSHGFQYGDRDRHKRRHHKDRRHRGRD